MGHRERGSPGEGLDRHCGLDSVVLRRSSSAGGDGQDQMSDAHPYYGERTRDGRLACAPY